MLIRSLNTDNLMLQVRVVIVRTDLMMGGTERETVMVGMEMMIRTRRNIEGTGQLLRHTSFTSLRGLLRKVTIRMCTVVKNLP